MGQPPPQRRFYYWSKSPVYHHQRWAERVWGELALGKREALSRATLCKCQPRGGRDRAREPWHPERGASEPGLPVLSPRTTHHRQPYFLAGDRASSRMGTQLSYEDAPDGARGNCHTGCRAGAEDGSGCTGEGGCQGTHPVPREAPAVLLLLLLRTRLSC